MLYTEDGKLCYLDFGLLVHVSPRHQQAMMAALIHLGLGEWSRLVDDLDKLDLLKPDTDRKRLAKELQNEFAAVLAADSNTSGTSSNLPLVSLQNSKIKFSTLIGVLFKTAFKFKFLLPSYFPLVVRAVASLEGLAVSIDPNFKLVAAGMPVVLNQLLSDRRPAAQELLQEVLLVPGGALRSDDTARQILEVWLLAAQQTAKSQRSSQFSLSLKTNNITGIEDMANLLLDRKNVPLRRTLMISNPAATIERMEPEMKEKLVRILTEALRKEESLSMARKLLQNNPASRAQRKRLWILFRATLPKVFSSPPKSIFKLMVFTFMILLAIVNALLQGWLSNLLKFWRRVTKKEEYA